MASLAGVTEEESGGWEHVSVSGAVREEGGDEDDDDDDSVHTRNDEREEDEDAG